MVCDICGRDGVRIRRVTRTYGESKNLLVIENIPLISCPNCRESYFAAETLHEIEQIKLNRKHLASTQSVAIAKFA